MKKNKIFPIVQGLIMLAIGLGLFGFGFKMFSTGLKGGLTKKVEHVPYEYGDVVTKENTVEGSKYSLTDGVEFIITEQNILTKEEIKNKNQFNDSSSDVAVLSITINNKSDKDFDYNIFGVNYASTNNIQLEFMSGIILDMPSPYDKMEDLGSGTLKPNNTVHKIRTISVPDGEKVKTIYWDYFGTEFTIELP